MTKRHTVLRAASLLTSIASLALLACSSAGGDSEATSPASEGTTTASTTAHAGGGSSASNGANEDGGASSTGSSGAGGSTGNGGGGASTSTGSTGDDGGTGGGGSGTASTGDDGGTAAPCVSGGGGSTGGPGDLFPCDSTWRKDVSALPVASGSSTMVSSVTKWGSGSFQIDFSFVFMHASASTPKVNVDVDWADESDVQPFPVPTTGSLEGESGYSCTQGGDCHLLVVDDSQQKLFELYSADDSTGKWTAEQESVWDLTHSYDARERGYGCTSADAAGLPVMAGLIGVRETKADAINHALRFILPNKNIRKGPSYVAPASHGTSSTSSTDGPPYGTRFRLSASFDESKVTSAGGKAIVHALKKYGMILADGGNVPLVAEDDTFEKAADPTMTWDGLLDANDLKAIEPSDFDVVDFGTIGTDDDCTLLTGL